ncbi:MAG: TonB-dependent receptor [Aureispira sp.]|nr:TonB-dependent receptor [Aureispira sp.]
MKTTLLVWLLMAMTQLSFAQKQTQIIKGKVIDKITKQPLVGALIFVEETSPIISTTSDGEGYFQLNNIPVGRQTIKAQKSEYTTFYTDNLLVRSAKEPYLEIALRKEITSTDKNQLPSDFRENLPLNDLSIVSTRSFSVEETQRYPGSINDPGRMAISFPGMQIYQDSENELFIRGASGTGTLFRIEGLDIPTVSHFNQPLKTGGGISLLNTMLLSNFDISTSAFAAEYGNAFSGVMDINFRKGNLYNREYRAQVGLLGIDFAAEGPFKQGKSSYLFNYRYSTLGILNAFGLYVVRDNVANSFQDLSFNLNFELPNNKSTITVFGLGGWGTEKWLVKDSSEWINSLDYEGIDYETIVATSGITFTHLLDEQSYLKVVGGASLNRIKYNRGNALANIDRVETNQYQNIRATLHAMYSRKFSDHVYLKTGLIGNGLFYDLLNENYNDGTAQLQTDLEAKGMSFYMQAYAQGSFRIGRRLTINAGGHALYLPLNNTYSLEPRFSLSYRIAKKTRLNIGYGLHGQILPIGTYLIQQKGTDGQWIQPNLDLKIPQAHHAVLSFRQLIGQDITLQAEFWYQHMTKVPVSVDSSNSFWYYNSRQNYGSQALVSEGIGRNYGVDLLFEKSFRKGYLITVSGSLFRSLYTGLDGVERRTNMDNIFSSSLMGVKEFYFKKGGILQLGLRGLMNGGTRYTPADMAASTAANQLILDETRPYEAGQLDEKRPFYYRLDARIAFRKDHRKFSYVISLDAQNVTNNTTNVFQQLYNIQTKQPEFRYHSGILPAISFEINF